MFIFQMKLVISRLHIYHILRTRLIHWWRTYGLLKCLLWKLSYIHWGNVFHFVWCSFWDENTEDVDLKFFWTQDLHQPTQKYIKNLQQKLSFIKIKKYLIPRIFIFIFLFFFFIFNITLCSIKWTKRIWDYKKMLL